MFVMVDKNLAVSLQEPEDLKTFKLVACVPISQLQEIVGALNGIATKLDGEHAWISQDWLRSQSNVRDDEAWQRAFDGVIVYAHKKGWVDDMAKTIRAHIEWA
jgi:hypothetical protein